MRVIRNEWRHYTLRNPSCFRLPQPYCSVRLWYLIVRVGCRLGRKQISWNSWQVVKDKCLCSRNKNVVVGYESPIGGLEYRITSKFVSLIGAFPLSRWPLLITTFVGVSGWVTESQIVVYMGWEWEENEDGSNMKRNKYISDREKKGNCKSHRRKSSTSDKQRHLREKKKKKNVTDVFNVIEK